MNRACAFLQAMVVVYAVRSLVDIAIEETDRLRGRRSDSRVLQLHLWLARRHQ